jgi:hypothetical protein
MASRPVAINIPHNLSQEQARSQIALGFSGISKQFTGSMLGMIQMTERWEGDRLHFEGGALGQKVTGRLDVLADSIQIQLDLPEFLIAIADRVIAGVKLQTQKLLAKR